MYLNQKNGKEYIIKEISCKVDSKSDLQKKKSDITLLIGLKGPTRLKIIESFSYNDKFVIVEEYCNQGALKNKIESKKVCGQKFDTDTILSYLAQITLAMLDSHCKLCTVGKISSEKLFLVDKILKIGFQTCPEGQKPSAVQTDVKSLGAILYELIMLKKFNEGSGRLPADTAPVLSNLFESIMNVQETPTIFDVARTPCLFNAIAGFVIGNQLMIELKDIMDIL